MSTEKMAFDLPPLPAYTLTVQEPVLPPIPDNILILIIPIVVYWAVSLFFHWIDVKDYFSQYRLHTPAELLKRNHVTRWEVVRDVIVQQIIQTAVGLVLAYFDEPIYVGREEYDTMVWATRIRIAQRYIPLVLSFVGIDPVGLAAKLSSYPMLAGAILGGKYQSLTQEIVSASGEVTIAPAFAGWEIAVASAIYWYIIPAIQFLYAITFIDTWQYFLHRAMHMNKWLYTTFHSRHHRLYVPYAFGALYNHPFEGFLLDTAGTGLAFITSRMTPRQAMIFFTVSVIKTVDDHCGYAFPWDPLQHITSNNAAYHDIHHQSWGIKTNFSQPFFTFWDRLLNTQWTGGDVTERYERARIAAQKAVDEDNAQKQSPTAYEDDDESASTKHNGSLHDTASRSSQVDTGLNSVNQRLNGNARRK
ncbi:hypothetical protein VTO42DRAFT_1925 [Malbranchea cinnamomea]